MSISDNLEQLWFFLISNKFINFFLGGGFLGIFSLKKLFICVILMLYAKIVKTKPDINLTLTRVETSKGRPGPEKWCCFLGARADIWAFTLSYFDRKSSILVLLHQICIISFAMRPIFRAPYTVQARARPICFNLF